MILEDENIEAEYLWFVARILSEFNDLKVIISFTQLLQTTEAGQTHLKCGQK